MFFSKKIIFLLSFLFYISSPLNAEDLWSLTLEELMQIEVYSANKTHETIKEIPASIYIVTRKDIKNYGYRTLKDTLENIPGMYNIYSYNGAPGNFGLRGFWNPNQQNSNFVILVNGIRQYSFDSRSSPLEQISVPVEAIDRIEVIRGPNAVIYGNGASFGVINIITNEVTDTKNSSLVSYSYGSLNTHRLAARVSMKENDFKIVLNAGTYKTDGLNNKFSDLMSPNNSASLPSIGIDNPNYSTKELLEQTNSYFSLSSSYKNWYLNFSYNQSDSEYFILYPSVEDGTVNESYTSITTLGYKNNLTKWLDIDLKGSYYRVNKETTFDAFSPDFHGIQDGSYNAYDLELISNIKVHEDINILLGFNYTSMIDLYEITDIPALGFKNDRYIIDDMPTQAVFSQINYQMNSQLNLMAGIRIEELKYYDRVFISDFGFSSENKQSSKRGNINISSPRVALVYNYDEDNTFKLMYAKSSRINNDNFDPEETKTLEINYLYISKDFYSSFSFFHNTLQNLLVPILGRDDDGEITTEEDTSGDFSTYGAELILHTNINENWLVELGITYQDTKDNNNKNIDVAYSPDTLVHFKTAYHYKKVNVALLGRYVDSMESFYDPGIDNGDGSFGARVGDKVDAYTVIDLNARIDNIYKDLYFNFKANNLFDTEVRYPNNNDNNTLLNKGTIGSGLELTATIGIVF